MIAAGLKPAVAALAVAAAFVLITLLPWSGADATVNIAPSAPAVVAPATDNCTRTELSARRIGAHATRYSTTYLYWVTARRTCPDGTTETYYYQAWRNS